MSTTSNKISSQAGKVPPPIIRASPLTDPCDEMLTKKELAAKLKVTERCIENWQRRGYLPYFKIASVVLFDWAVVRAYLKANFQVCRGGAVRPRS